jgi:type II secretory pathway predicted ATPase ExeA
MLTVPSAMKLLYQEYFGLTQPPFNVTPDPGFLYLSASHREGLAQISYGIKARKGFVVLTGEVGTGKTTLIHSLLKDLDDYTQTALIFSAITNSLDLLRSVCEEFKLTEPLQPARETHDYIVLLNEFLLSNYRKGRTCALIIDEAQNLTNEVLESVRLLSNLDTSSDKLLQILLVGQPELAVRLNRPELRQLKQRVTLRYQLQPLSLRECESYISSRLKIAGGSPAVFHKRAIQAIYAYSGGIPRLINVLADNALLTAFAMGKNEVDRSIIQEAAEDLALCTPEQPFQQRFELLRGARLEGKSREARATVSANNPSVAPANSAITLDQANVPLKLFEAIVEHLTEAMGPMASFVLGEQIRLHGHRIETFPQNKLPKLIQSVSQEILDASMREEFLTATFELLRSLQPTQTERDRLESTTLSSKHAGRSSA